MELYRMMVVALCSFVFCVPVAQADTPPIQEIVVFGESTSDTGNVDILNGQLDPPSTEPPSVDPYWEGRLCNGPVWVEYMAEALAITIPGPSLVGGTNYAHAGAKTGSGYNKRVSLITGAELDEPLVPKIGTQIDAFLADHGEFQNDQLVVIWGGANDIRDVQDLEDVFVLIDNLEQHIRLVAANGAKHVLVPNQLNSSRAPFFKFVRPDLKDQVELVIQFFNYLLDLMLDGLDADPTLDITIHRLDAFTFGEAILDDPQAFGFTNATGPTIVWTPQGFVVVQDPETAVFWDLIHPTTKTYQFFADFALVCGRIDVLVSLLEEEIDGVFVIEIGGNNSAKTRSGLQKKLSDARSKLDEGKWDDAADKLLDFVDKVLDLQAQGKLSEEDATRLLSEAEFALGILCAVRVL